MDVNKDEAPDEAVVVVVPVVVVVEALLLPKVNPVPRAEVLPSLKPPDELTDVLVVGAVKENPIPVAGNAADDATGAPKLNPVGLVVAAAVLVAAAGVPNPTPPEAGLLPNENPLDVEAAAAEDDPPSENPVETDDDVAAPGVDPNDKPDDRDVAPVVAIGFAPKEKPPPPPAAVAVEDAAGAPPPPKENPPVPGAALEVAAGFVPNENPPVAAGATEAVGLAPNDNPPPPPADNADPVAAPEPPPKEKPPPVAAGLDAVVPKLKPPPAVEVDVLGAPKLNVIIFCIMYNFFS